MERREHVVLCCLSFFFFWISAAGVNPEVLALTDIKASLVDSLGVLESWDVTTVDPCGWGMVSCSADHSVIALGASSQNLSGTLSPSIGNLTNLQILLMHNNNISGPIPAELGRLQKLQTLVLSNNFFTGQLPNTLSHLKGLKCLRLNNNSLSGSIPLTLANMTQLTFLDLSNNNLGPPVPEFHVKTFNIVGNPLICATGNEKDCCEQHIYMPLSSALSNPQNSETSGRPKSHKIALAFASSLGCICLLILGFGFLLWWRQRYSK
ncbi:Protein NSP-INTERACTING KINASE 1 like [Quillaja saponaria]|uniref:Protein NSP-INTERACTING KINASE 1 like n=1 Tax=Quillaja saponaria TaxID=32244 RepID=A0AAD7KQV4_QUISA|nr:Protein NSP-INTERACTING KINASE 1 like [Quillaja saponaria]